MIRTLLFRPGPGTLEQGGPELVQTWLAEPQASLWIDCFEEPAEAESALFQQSFGLHPLAITDAQRERHPPKVERFDDSLFLLLRGLTGILPTLESDFVQIALFVGPRFLVSRRSRPSPSIEGVFEQAAKEPALLGRGPAHLAGRVARRVADRYFMVLVEIEGRLEELESEIFGSPDDRLLEELIGYRTSLEKFRRVLNYHALAFADLRQKQPESFDDDLEHQYIDVHEQFDRDQSLTALLYGLCADLMDGYISVSSHRMNNILKILTIVTTIFVPLGFLAGIYGMNFQNMPELASPRGYHILLGVMAVIAATTLAIFRRIRWL